MKKYWASVGINISYDIGLYDGDYIEAENEEEAERLAKQRVLLDSGLNGSFMENDITVYCVGEVEDKEGDHRIEDTY